VGVLAITIGTNVIAAADSPDMLWWEQQDCDQQLTKFATSHDDTRLFLVCLTSSEQCHAVDRQARLFT
jgi:hypothetical protein